MSYVENIAHTPIYKSEVGGHKYFVIRHDSGRWAGRLCLYVDDLSATQSIGGSGPTGIYYDTIAHLIPKHQNNNILLLGAAGGTIAHRYRDLGGKGFIYAIDNDPEILKIARLFFQADKYINILDCQDAFEFIKNAKPVWDCVINDLYTVKAPSIVDTSPLLKRGGLFIWNEQSGRTVRCLQKK